MARNVELMPPHDREAEAAVLGALLLLGTQPEPQARELTREILTSLHDGDFHDLKFRRIHAAIHALHAAGKPHDLVAVKDALNGDLEAAGGPAAIMALYEACPSAANARHYAEIVRRDACRRQLILACRKATDEAHRQSDVEENLGGLLAVADTIQERLMPERRLPAVAEVLDGIDADLYQSQPRAMLTGYDALDDALGGILPGQVIVVGARPSMGKTTLALNLMAQICRSGGCGVFLSLETSRAEVFKTLLALNGGMPRWKMKPRFQAAITETDRLRHVEAKDTVNALRLDVLDDKRTYRQPAWLDTEIRRMHRKMPIDLLVVDHFHLMDHGSGRERPDVQMGRTSQLFQGLAKETGIPIVILAQLNRTIEQDARAPRLSDLRECGKLEEDADAVLFLSPDPHERATHAGRSNRIVLTIAKNKLGPCGRLLLYRDPDSLKYSELDVREEHRT